MTTLPRLLPTEQRLVDALAARRLTLAEPLRRPLVNSLAAELGWTPAEVRAERDRAREQCGYPRPHQATGRPRGWAGRKARELEREGKATPAPSRWLPEAPTLPLGCADAAVVARCQREGRRLGERVGKGWRA